MKRNTYVDNQGNSVNESFESKKILLRFFFLIGTIVPLVLLGFIIYTAIQNNDCNTIYNHIKSATKDYLKDADKFPDIEGENVIVSVGKLYNEQYLSAYSTKNMTCTGNVKITKYKKDYVYTLNLTNCNSCTTTSRYKNWSGELDYYPNKPIVDVIPYYNYYERQTVVTDWSKFYEENELQKKKSKYGVRLPKKEEDIQSKLPTLPEEAKIAEIQQERGYFYRYKDKVWKWYDIKGNYSGFSSEKPAGYANKDEDTLIYTEWTKYSLNYPEEKEYREIHKTTGYQYYYEEDGEKIYANNKNFVADEDIDQNKYTMHEDQGVDMFSYRDSKWRWYNGEKRKYSVTSSEKPDGYNFKDDETLVETNYSEWEPSSTVNDSNKTYRIEEKKHMTRYRYVYEILSAPVLKAPVTKNLFVEKVGISVPDFVVQDNYKMEVSYKFKYRKR